MDKKEYRRRYKQKYRPAYKALMKFYPFTLEDLPGEVWKVIPDWQDYHASNFGRVKSFKYKTPRILSPGLVSSGYLFVNLSKDNKSKLFRAHRLVAELFIPNPESKPQVNHLDGCRLNNHVSNLEWVTSSENNQHAYDNGFQPSGVNHCRAKLTAEQVEFIRANPESLTGRQLAKMFGVTPSTINLIQIGKNWKRAGGNLRESNKHPGRKLQDDIRAQIRAEYQKGVVGYGSRALGKKYGVSEGTIRNIVHEV